MMGFALLIARKDLGLILFRGRGLAQALLLGLLLLFIFNLAKDTGEIPAPREAAAIFWLASSFCQILMFNQLYALEETNSARESLVLAPRPMPGIWLGKGVAGMLLLLLAQIVFLPATIVFLGQNISGPIWTGLCGILLGDLGMCALGSLLGAACQGQSGRESLLSVILFPLLAPLLLAAIGLLAQTFGANNPDGPGAWLGLAAAFDAIFLGVGLVLFGFLYRGEL